MAERVKCIDCEGAGGILHEGYVDHDSQGGPYLEKCPTCCGVGTYELCPRCETEPVALVLGGHCIECLEEIDREDAEAHERAHRAGNF
jgi:hypothetical protein